MSYVCSTLGTLCSLGAGLGGYGCNASYELSGESGGGAFASGAGTSAAAGSGGSSGCEELGLGGCPGPVGGAGGVSAGAAGGAGITGAPGEVTTVQWEGRNIDLCTRGGYCGPIDMRERDKVDVLFVIDNTASMREEQRLLALSLPGFIESLTSSADNDADGLPDQRFASSVRFGVVSTDMGTLVDVPDCGSIGDDAVLRSTPSLDVGGCQPMYGPFLEHSAGDDVLRTATDIECIATLGGGGCSVSQPLEASLKALWPRSDARVTFEPYSVSGRGQGADGANAGFLRDDSVIALVLLTRSDDCSSFNGSHLTAADQLPSDDPRRMQGPDTRCALEAQRDEPNNLHDVERYINSLQALRALREDVVFGAITGIPYGVGAVAPRDRLALDDDYGWFDAVLAAPEMQPTVDDRGTPQVDDDRMLPACESENGAAAPARRILEVARGMHERAEVGSICADDYDDTMARIVDSIRQRLGPSCLENTLVRSSDKRVPCDLLWLMPAPGTAPAETPLECDHPGFSFLEETMRAGVPADRRLCRVEQLTSDSMGNVGAGQGFYYDDFSSVAGTCRNGVYTRVAYSPLAEPPEGVDVFLDCDPFVPIVSE